MQKFTFKRQATGFYTDQQINLSTNQMELLSFIGNTFSKENFSKQIETKKKSFTVKQREILALELKKKYAAYERTEVVQTNLDNLLLENTFTITTGHQLSIFTGPIYLIYKIIHVIRLAEELKKTYPENNFVPVFWMASEDHDFEEIRSFEIFNKKLNWETEQEGAVGKFETEGLEALRNEVLEFFENQGDSEVKKVINEYSGKDLGEATFKLIHSLFDRFGLLIVDGDNSVFKKEFIPVIEKELKEQFSYKAVIKTNKQVEKEGMKLQANAREINLFYLGDQSRERILHIDDAYFIESKGELTKDEILFELYQYPERFSPNVILRPVYQEKILPNLCYIGGVGEMAYWLQIKGVFDAINLPYPLIQTRTSILWIDLPMAKKMAKVDLKLQDLFLDRSIVKKNYLKSFAAEELDFTDFDLLITKLKSELNEKIKSLDNHLENYGKAELVKLDKQMDAIKDKLLKTVKLRHEATMKIIDQVYDKFFPNNSMQERYLNFFTLCSDGNISSKLETLHRFIDPFDPDFVIIRE